MRRRCHLFVSGRVQGVYFRAHTCREARALGLCGWVQNLADGRVEVVVEGDTDAVARLLDWCRRGTPPARVDDLMLLEEVPTGEFTDFKIRP